MDRIADPTLCFRVQEAEGGDRAARELLIRIYKEAAKTKRLDSMPLVARLYIEELVDINGGKLPSSIGGRSRATHREFALAVAVEVERTHGLSIARAVRVVALKAGRSPRASYRNGKATVEKAYVKWQDTREMKAEMSRRCLEAPKRLSEVKFAALAALEPAPLRKPPRTKLR